MTPALVNSCAITPWADGTPGAPASEPPGKEPRALGHARGPSNKLRHFAAQEDSLGVGSRDPGSWGGRARLMKP